MRGCVRRNFPTNQKILSERFFFFWSRWSQTHMCGLRNTQTCFLTPAHGAIYGQKVKGKAICILQLCLFSVIQLCRKYPQFSTFPSIFDSVCERVSETKCSSVFSLFLLPILQSYDTDLSSPLPWPPQIGTPTPQTL